MNNITEALVVTCIIGVVAIATGFTFQGWIGKHRTENYIHELYTDMMRIRMDSAKMNEKHFVRFPDRTSYEVYRDNGNHRLSIRDDTLLRQFPKRLLQPYRFTIGASSAPSFTFNFDRKGMSSALRTICIFTDHDGDRISDYDPSYDCMIIHWTRINKGKLTKQDTAGGLCDTTNCMAQ